MAKINEATDTDLKIIEDLKKAGWKPGDTLLYQQEYSLTPEQQKLFEGKKSIRPDITLTDLSGNILAVFENKFEDEKKSAYQTPHTLRSSFKTPFFICLFTRKDSLLRHRMEGPRVGRISASQWLHVA